jgi:hypothetical protein
MERNKPFTRHQVSCVQKTLLLFIYSEIGLKVNKGYNVFFRERQCIFRIDSEVAIERRGKYGIKSLSISHRRIDFSLFSKKHFAIIVVTEKTL